VDTYEDWLLAVCMHATTACMQKRHSDLTCCRIAIPPTPNSSHHMLAAPLPPPPLSGSDPTPGAPSRSRSMPVFSSAKVRRLLFWIEHQGRMPRTTRPSRRRCRRRGEWRSTCMVGVGLGFAWGGGCLHGVCIGVVGVCMGVACMGPGEAHATRMHTLT